MGKRIDENNRQNDTPAPQTQETEPRKDRPSDFKRFCDRMRSDIKVPLWVLLLLITMILIMLAILNPGAHKPVVVPAEPTSATNVVTAQQGSIAINGDVTLTITPDRLTTKEGGTVDMTRTQPLVYINYQGEDKALEEPVKVDGTGISVGEEVKVESTDKK